MYAYCICKYIFDIIRSCQLCTEIVVSLAHHVDEILEILIVSLKCMSIIKSYSISKYFDSLFVNLQSLHHS